MHRRNQSAPSASKKPITTKYGIIPTTIVKEIRPPLSNSAKESDKLLNNSAKVLASELEQQIADLEKEMREAAKNTTSNGRPSSAISSWK
jgi:excinuclease UvrABC helicase subunit UvrB